MGSQGGTIGERSASAKRANEGNEAKEPTGVAEAVRVAGGTDDPATRAERAWAVRAVRNGADLRTDVRADSEAVEAAVAAWRDAVARDPDHPGLRARLLHALDFQGEYLIQGEGARRKHFAAARELGEEGFERLARRLGDPEALRGLEPAERAEALRAAVGDTGWTVTDLAALHLRGAIVWGKWAERVGAFKAAREGVADELRTLAGTALELDETYSEAGPHRFLGRLHSDAPKIPFFTGWVDRGEAVRHLERAVELAPEEPENLLFLAEALREHRPNRRDEARALLRELTRREPRPDRLLEDTRTLERARELLAEP